MKKIYPYILTVIVAFLALNVFASPFSKKQIPQHFNKYELSKHQTTNSFNALDFINETEDDLNEGKHQNNVCSFNYNQDVRFNFPKQKLILLANISNVCSFTIYQGVPLYISFGNHRV